MRTSKEGISFIPLLLYVSVALAILTQCFLEASLLRTAMYATWMFLFFLMLALRRFKFKISRATFHFYCAIAVFVLYVLVQSFFTDMKALNGYYISGLALIAFISAGSSTLMSSGAVLPEAENSFTDARNVADALFEPVSQERKKRSNSESKRLTKGHEEMNL